MDQELHRADPVLKKRASWLLLGVVIGAVAALAFGSWLLQRAGASDPQILLMGYLGLAVVLACIALTLGWSLWQAAQRVTSEDRYPPSDMQTLHDVPVQHGANAAQRARWLAAGAVVSALFGVGVLVGAIVTVHTLF